MKYDKPAKGNPRQITIRQHVFPIKSLSRFTNSTGKLSVLRRDPEHPVLQLDPSNPMFCAMRAWDQVSEHGYMKTIEDQFQALADEIVNGRQSLEGDHHLIVARFYALWRLRVTHRGTPMPERVVHGMPHVGDVEQQENLEIDGQWFVKPDGILPRRLLTGLMIRAGTIESMQQELESVRWGIARALQGEFLLPDQFSATAIVPVTPTICLIGNWGDVDLLMNGVLEVNKTALREESGYLIARDLFACPPFQQLLIRSRQMG